MKNVSETLSIEVTHSYGLAETYGPLVVCAWHELWAEQLIEERTRLRSRQGVRSLLLEGLMIAGAETMQ